MFDAAEEPRLAAMDIQVRDAIRVASARLCLGINGVRSLKSVAGVSKGQCQSQLEPSPR
jgi:hypothetical protein